MSYEGFEQYLCKHGHYWTLDAIEMKYSNDYDNIKCPTCGEKPVWWNDVDKTNGENVGYVEVEQESQSVCNHCGSILNKKYKLPPLNVGHHIKEKEHGRKEA